MRPADFLAWSCLPLLALFVFACSDAPTGDVESAMVEADDYERSCVADEDCVLIREGDPCGCGCPNASISSSAESTYQEDLDRAAQKCDHREICGSLDSSQTVRQAASCPMMAAACLGGQCEAVSLDQPEGIEAFDKSCESDADCELVPEVLCQGCACPAALSAEGAADARRVRQVNYCDMEEDAHCPCDAPAAPSCVDGVCQAPDCTTQVAWQALDHCSS